MKAISVFPGKANSVHLADLTEAVTSIDVPNGRGVLVKVFALAWMAPTKKSMPPNMAPAPPGYDFLVIGHEGFGRVEAVGPNVTELKAGRLRRRHGPPSRQQHLRPDRYE